MFYNTGMTKESVFIIFFVIFSIFAGNFILNGGYMGKDSSCGAYKTEELLFGDKSVIVEISDNDCKRALGLSGRKELRQDAGMLFIFKEEGGHGIWMKDMIFPIDIFWVNSQKEIVLIEKSVYPETYPEVFGESVFSKFVIELPSGFADANNIKEGDKIQISSLAI